MNTKSQPERFQDVAANEIKTRQLRLPIWNQAMIAAGGDVKTAEEVYITLRVQQMETDEDQQAHTREARVARDRAEEQTPRSRFISKTLLLLLIAIVFFALFAILYFRPK